jgi:hypothetical protein
LGFARDELERDEPEPDRAREELERDEPDPERDELERERDELELERDRLEEPEREPPEDERRLDDEELRELLDERRRPEPEVRRSAAGISSRATALASCEICVSRNFAIRSSSRRMLFASLAVSLSPTLSASASMPA